MCDVSGPSKEEKRALSILESTTKYNSDRYEHGLMLVITIPIRVNTDTQLNNSSYRWKRE